MSLTGGGFSTPKNVSIEVDEQAGEPEVTITDAPATAVPGTMAVGVKISASNKREYWITVNGQLTVSPDQSPEDAADALRRFMVSHHRLAEQAFLAAN